MTLPFFTQNARQAAAVFVGFMLSLCGLCQEGYIEERSALGPVNLSVPGGSSAGSLALPLRLLDGFCLYTQDANGAEEVVSLERLEDGTELLDDPL